MAAFEYRYKVDGLFKVEAQVAGEVCERLQNSPQGLSPKTLLDESRDENAPLHGIFEWNDGIAAEKYRLQQGHDLIRNIAIVIKKEDLISNQERAFVVKPGRQSAYVSLKSALTNDKWREHLLQQARQDARAFLEKYKRLEELSHVNSAIGEFLENVG